MPGTIDMNHGHATMIPAISSLGHEVYSANFETVGSLDLEPHGLCSMDPLNYDFLQTNTPYCKNSCYVVCPVDCRLPR